MSDRLFILKDGKKTGEFTRSRDLVFTSNSYKIVEFQMLKQKRLKAQLAADKAG